MNDNLYNYIYDAMCLALEHLEDDVNNQNLYDKLDRATGKFQDWYDNATEKLEEIQSICIGADSPDAQERTKQDPVSELKNCQQDLGAISNIVEELLTK